MARLDEQNKMVGFCQRWAQAQARKFLLEDKEGTCIVSFCFFTVKLESVRQDGHLHFTMTLLDDAIHPEEVATATSYWALETIYE